MRNLSIDELRGHLRRTDDLLAGGLSRRELDRSTRADELVRVRPGTYMDGTVWRGLWPESRHLARVIAVADDARGEPPVFALTSAAAIHGLPLYRIRPDRVHIAVPGAGRHSAPDVARHVARLGDADLVERAGLWCTSADRTAYDLARLAAPEVAVSCADAVAAQVGGDPRRYAVAAVEQWRSEMRDRVAMAGVRGIRQARVIIDLADGRSQRPLESVTKLQLHRLGFRVLALQVPVPDPHGGSYWVDLEVCGASRFYECDGETKYTDEALRSGRSLEQVLLDEKRREDWIRGTTGIPVIRGGSVDSASPAALARRLVSFGVTLPDRRERLLLPSRPPFHGQ